MMEKHIGEQSIDQQQQKNIGDAQSFRKTDSKVATITQI